MCRIVVLLLVAGTAYADLPQSTLPPLSQVFPKPAPVIIQPVIVPRIREPQHSHRCGACGFVFSHGESSFGNAQAHRCPKCGAGPWWQQVPGSRRTIGMSSFQVPMSGCPT
jgi:hypothetical protein